MSEPAPSPAMCSNCKGRPAADVVLCGFTDWCADCDASLHAHWQLEIKMAEAAAPEMCSNCHSKPIADVVLCGFTDWCADCDGSLHAARLSEEAAMCTNCKCRPVADAVLCGWTDWCADCDASLHRHQEHVVKCDKLRVPRPPPDPFNHNRDLCPCGWFAIRNRPLQRAGKENMPLHMLVTVPITSTLHIIVCLICESTFKHHHNAVRHVQRHHLHYHHHHPDQKRIAACGRAK